MTRLIAVTFTAAMLFATIGCNEPEPHPVASCDGLPAQCQTSRALRVCEDDVWTVRSCEDECASEGGYPFGCLRIPDGDDVCNCEGDAEGCAVPVGRRASVPARCRAHR